MLKKILLGAGAAVALLIVVFAIAVLMQPSEYRVQRSLAMAAPQERVFEQVNDFHNWQPWSPWAKLDPNAKYTFEGPPSGTGAIYRWAGNDKVGEGHLTITESQPPESIRLKLVFIKPMPGVADTEFTFKPEGERTRMTWTMSGKNEDFMSKAFCLFMNMDTMIGGDFEKGMALIKEIVERPTSSSNLSAQPQPESSTAAATKSP